MILWNYINFNTYIYKPMVMNIAIIFNDFFNANLRIPKY